MEKSLALPSKKAAIASRRNGVLGGRPAGSILKTTQEKRISFDYMKGRVIESSQHLLDAQLALARGLSFLYVIEKDEKGKEQKPRVVKSRKIIEAFLAGQLDNSPHRFFFLATEKPDTHVIDSLLDRFYGKAGVMNELPEGDGKNPFTPTSSDQEMVDSALAQI